jgi:hypothetical protein
MPTKAFPSPGGRGLEGGGWKPSHFFDNYGIKMDRQGAGEMLSSGAKKILGERKKPLEKMERTPD